ncbi:uncharacterized protein B0I36DRAFT_338458 [Microdochium trichocladiopsis]|uniref:Uncharacterized protein n=1 Tax=Microdochium trichocladiopsis TaxID=1682393 RepID=A0A9P8XRN5_9PEZI|nr:uncharacterized protein B0I36DRAFT_338458 [Microdochium trichocladiopsis]KAH7014240.1 hypothetical protein B0I36DRAFT_338458 [Microdochium trichocladiopsis]
MRPDPSMPFSAVMQDAADALEAELDAYMVEGNRITRDLYRGLAMPWDVEKDLGFDRESFRRVEWATAWEGGEVRPMDEFFAPVSQAGGVVGASPGTVTAAAPSGPPKITTEIMEMMMSTGSPVIRWREAHPELVGTEQDVVRKFRRVVEKCLVDAAMGLDEVKGGLTGVMLLVKKK